ncbi:Gpi1-domain-containing protein [Yamadazyma tenuis ATCC 10573]|uniref:Gpi1-domain-containing protein n=1 Tax=Candida tenuis (strain ATCC 10573 / BCRC 21748 / CBS 615 / JCM 9827 / NBRC 10315 / NRRL Y-1498 / VKM Y-70) TaxID=590646 RepID=G3B598_CANTC|nr:Gpi1-domain-containing protein [Yamadazyma tenuis ATCC 10573]EGV63167.1 Gpi1-domain-containing protein [Yamadazyma tenuis ATCC 10573]
MFKPPNYRNLEYFSLRPISLQSMGTNEVNSETVDLNGCFTNSYKSPSTCSTISDQDTLDKINGVLKLRFQLESLLKEMSVLSERTSFGMEIFPKLWRWIFSLLFTLVSWLVLTIQMCTVFLMRTINAPLFGVSLVDVSQVFRQLDLRLKQITYFPIQFLCYYDKSILYKDKLVLLKELGLPDFNFNLNINNSNYINLYNSVWLIVNDVLLGATTWNVLVNYGNPISVFLNEYVFERVLFSDFHKLITWISYNHPAGFKLNNELGSFMGSLFLWSLNSWKVIIQETILSETNKRFSVTLTNVLCHLGVTFLLAFILDILNLTTIHIVWFYHTSARIYQKQVEILKSLFQLFRGKKYNVLRNRVDHLDNYSQPNEFLEVDQLLLGTLLFMILVLLLPTIFAFYLTFFMIRLSNILVLNFFENLLIIINFVPIFVILLKFKNSSRLQGGLKFQILDKKLPNCSYLELSNKSLTYSEIFKNFAALFKRLKNFRTSILSVFFKGNLISLNHQHSLKFNYLMLPENVEKSIDIWKYFTNTL